MKYIIKIFFIFTLSLFSNIYSQSSGDFKTDSLFVVWGIKNYSGKNDCSAEVSLNSDGRKIIIQVNVEDDKLVLNNDPLNSDHVELWFSLPEISNDRYIISDSSLYLINNLPDLEKFTSYLKNPLIRSYDSGIDSLYYSQMNNGYYGWLKSPVNEYFADAHTSNLYVENVPLGIVHFGILPNSAHVIEYDTSLYSPIEKSTDTKFDNFSRHINFTKHISENGYSLNIIIPPEALGFTLKYGIERLKFLIDIVDVDNKNTQETLLSTSKNRKWGDPSTFNSIDLKNHIYVAINKNIPSLGQKVSYNTVYDKVIDMVSKYFVYTKKGWLPIDINDISFYEYNQPEVYVIENISKIQIKQGILKYRKEIVNNNLLEHFICSGGSYVIMNKERLLTKESIIQTIILPNGKPAFIYSEFEITGRYTRQIFSYLYLVTDTLKQLIATYGDLYPTEISLPYLDKTVKIKWGSNLEWYGGDENIDWENAIGYNKGNRFLILNLSDSLHYKITWDKEGKIIK